MDVLALLRRENRPLMPAEIAKRLGKTPAGVRSRLCRLAQEGLVARTEEGYIILEEPPRGEGHEREESPAPPVRQRCLDNARQRVQVTAGNAFGQHQATVGGNGGQRPVYWSWQVWEEAFDAVLGGLGKKVDQAAREGLFVWAMLHLGMTPENHVLHPEAALLLQTSAIRQAVEVRRRLRPPRRRGELAWLLGCDGDDNAEPDEVQARFRRIRQEMELRAAEILEGALR